MACVAAAERQQAAERERRENLVAVAVGGRVVPVAAASQSLVISGSFEPLWEFTPPPPLLCLWRAGKVEIWASPPRSY